MRNVYMFSVNTPKLTAKTVRISGCDNREQALSDLLKRLNLETDDGVTFLGIEEATK